MDRNEPNLERVSPKDSVTRPSARTRSILLLVSDLRIYQDFAEWVMSSSESKGESILHVLFNGAISLASEESPTTSEVLSIADVRDCDNEIEMTKRTLDALSRMEKFDKVFFDPLSPLSEMFSEDSAPAYMLKELVPFLDHRGSLGYFCLTLDSHDNVTVAQCKDSTDVCIQVTKQDGSLLVQALSAKGIYTKDFFLPRVCKNWPAIEGRARLPSGLHPTMKTAVGIE
ncbi:MAG: hypothetical protein LN417_00645 [Candidatus Thermoplasmatota archaeon]|nr:hypothetical protein [Candidatus Thermoplasmatota archaeon]